MSDAPPSNKSENQPGTSRRQHEYKVSTKHSEAPRSRRSVDRDSKVSLRDDPFFRPYHSLQATRLADQAKLNEDEHSPVNRRNDPYPPVRLAVLGMTAVGKSTFIQRSLDLRSPNTRPSASKKMSLDGIIYRVTLIEMSIEMVTLTKHRKLKWPTRIGNEAMPEAIDGVLVLYDVTQKQSLLDLYDLLEILQKSKLQWLLVACKCDNPPNARQIDTKMVEEAQATFPGIKICQTSGNVPETQRACISLLLQTIAAQSAEKNVTESQGSAAQTLYRGQTETTVPPCLTQVRRSSTGLTSHHSRNSSDPSSLYHRHSQSIASGSSQRPGSADSVALGSASSPINDFPSPSAASRSFVSPFRITTTLYTSPAPPRLPLDQSTFRSSDRKKRIVLPAAAGGPINGPITLKDLTVEESLTFLNMDEDFDHISDVEAGKDDNGPPIMQPIDHRESVSDTGTTFDELVDRLCDLKVSKADFKFSSIFLCFYRKFAAPVELLDAIISRFDKTEGCDDDGDASDLERIGHRQGFLKVIVDWLMEYPGDFAYPRTREKLIDFITRVEKDKVCVFAAAEMTACLPRVVEDDDTNWACSDKDKDPNYKEEQPVKEELSIDTNFLTVSTSRQSLNTNSSNEDLSKESSRKSSKATDISTSTKRTSITASSGKSGSENASTSSLQATLKIAEKAQREAQKLTPVPRYMMGKLHWHKFMEEYSDTDFATQLTRIDWILFQSIRPRDLVRYDSLRFEQKEKCKNLGTVKRMADQFNHVAYWIASLILLREKPKHRARALEKFMSVAWKLRQQNNYNSLAAVIAGINSTPIIRLAQTREMVLPEAAKQFRSLEILMSSKSSHATYRLAWGNTTKERIPYLPLVRRDLVSTEEGNRTFIGEHGDRINWKKFEVLGDIITGIQKCQNQGYPLISENEELQRLILDTKLAQEDDSLMGLDQELYDKSVALEPVGAAGAGQKKFGWLRN